MPNERDYMAACHRFARDPRCRESFEQLRTELSTLPASCVLPVQVDVLSCVLTALDAVPRVKELRDAVAIELRGYDLERYDRLELYTRALAYAHAEYFLGTQPEEPLAPLQRAGADCLAKLVNIANMIGVDGVPEVDAGPACKTRARALPLAQHLDAVAYWLHERDVFAGNHGRLSVKQFDRALLLADRIRASVHHERKSNAWIDSKHEARQRTYTLFVASYEHVRRAVRYLRWDHRDGNHHAPSVYTRREHIAVVAGLIQRGGPP